MLRPAPGPDRRIDQCSRPWSTTANRTEARPDMTESAPKRRSRKGQWVIIVIFALALLLNGILWWMRPNDERMKASVVWAEGSLVPLGDLGEDVVACESALSETERLLGSVNSVIVRVEEDGDLNGLHDRLVARKAALEKRIEELRR